MCVEGLDDAAGRLGFGDQEIDRRAGAAMERVCENTVSVEFKQTKLNTFVPFIRSGEWSDIGSRDYMEDAHVCISDLAKNFGYNSVDDEVISFYGVFDGHNGKDAAHYVRDNLPRVIVEDADFPLELEKVVKRSFVQTDSKFAEKFSHHKGLSSGTTALTAMIFGRSLLVANAGLSLNRPGHDPTADALNPSPSFGPVRLLPAPLRSRSAAASSPMALLKNSLMLQGRLRHAAAAALTARRGAATATEEYARRNYADNTSEYNTVIGSLVAQRRPYLLRDAYDDMMLDGVKPERDTFHTLIVGTMKGSRLQDALYFRDQMKEMGLLPDVNLYNFLISTCGKCKNSDAAIMLLEEMKAHGVKLKGETYICLLNALASTGQTDQVYAIVSDMSAAGLGLNKFCYAGLITAFKNKTPTAEETMAKILDFVRQSKGWQYVERVSKDSAENIMMNVSEEELYNLPTAEYVNRRGGFVFKQHTVYHVAIHACAELRSKETLEALLEMFNKDNRDGSTYDAYMVMQAMRCYLRCGDIDSAVKMFEEYSSSRSPPAELYATLAEGAMIGYTPRGMQLAQETIEKMISRNFFLNARLGTDLLLAAAGETTGGYTTANYVWDLLQSRNVTPNLPAVEAYHKGLTAREIPSDDPRLLNVARVLDNLQLRFGPRRNTQ